MLIIISMNRVRGIYHQAEVERDWRRGEVVEKIDGEKERERENVIHGHSESMKGSRNL